MKFTEYLEETIKAGYKNEELWLDYLKDKYSKVDVEKYYITFVAVDKVGINPQTPYDTPMGVYTYPLKYVLEEEHVPFRGDNSSNKIKILKRFSEKGLTSDATDKELEDCEKLMIEKYGMLDRDVEDFKRVSNKRDNNYGKIWNITRRCANLINRQNNKDKAIIPKSISMWTKLLLELGYEYSEDDGKGIIHPNEPHQAVFFSPKAYKVVDEHEIDTEAKYKNFGNKKYKKVDLWLPTKIKELIKMKQYRQLLVTDDEGEDALLVMLRLSKKDSEELKSVFDYSVKHQVPEFLPKYLYNIFNNPYMNDPKSGMIEKYGKPVMKLVTDKKLKVTEEHKKFYKWFFDSEDMVDGKFSIGGEPSVVLDDFLEYIS